MKIAKFEANRDRRREIPSNASQRTDFLSQNPCLFLQKHAKEHENFTFNQIFQNSKFPVDLLPFMPGRSEGSRPERQRSNYLSLGDTTD